MRLTFETAGKGALAFCASNDARWRRAEWVFLTPGERVKRAFSGKVAGAERSRSAKDGILIPPNSAAKTAYGNRINPRRRPQSKLAGGCVHLESLAVCVLAAVALVCDMK